MFVRNILFCKLFCLSQSILIYEKKKHEAVLIEKIINATQCD